MFLLGPLDLNIEPRKFLNEGNLMLRLLTLDHWNWMLNERITLSWGILKWGFHCMQWSLWVMFIKSGGMRVVVSTVGHSIVGCFGPCLHCGGGHPDRSTSPASSWSTTYCHMPTACWQPAADITSTDTCPGTIASICQVGTTDVNTQWQSFGDVIPS